VDGQGQIGRQQECQRHRTPGQGSRVKSQGPRASQSQRPRASARAGQGQGLGKGKGHGKGKGWARARATARAIAGKGNGMSGELEKREYANLRTKLLTVQSLGQSM
jgi:hypothetical protein